MEEENKNRMETAEKEEPENAKSRTYDALIEHLNQFEIVADNILTIMTLPMKYYHLKDGDDTYAIVCVRNWDKEFEGVMREAYEKGRYGGEWFDSIFYGWLYDSGYIVEELEYRTFRFGDSEEEQSGDRNGGV